MFTLVQQLSVLLLKVIINLKFTQQQQNCTTLLCTSRVDLYLYFEMTLKKIYNLCNDNNKAST